jgi:hypothetical protein
MGRAATPSMGIGGIGRKLSRVVEVAITTTIAWIFGLSTAAILVYLAMGLYTGDSSFASPLSLLNPDNAAHPWGLSFSSMTGAYIAVGMAAGVMVTLGMSMMFNSGMRKLGLLGMIFWSGLWAFNAIMVAKDGWSGGKWTGDQRMLIAALALVAIFACMVHRAIRVWRIRVTM